MLGEDEATYLGVNVRRLRWTVLAANVVVVSVATAFVGIIAFVGLVTPHIVRGIAGPKHRTLIAASALLGGAFLASAEFLKRVRAFSRAEDVVVVGVVHDLDLAARFADKVVLLSNGRLVGAGPPREVLTAGHIEKVFGVTPHRVELPGGGLHLVFE